MDYVDSYYARTIEEPSDYPSLSGDLDVEILVVGGGLAGVATALDLAERGRTVALIEANLVGWGASGRNGGFASEGFALSYVTLVKRIGRERAREIHGVARMGLSLVRDRIDAYGIACGPVRQGALRCNIAGRGDDLLAFRDFMARTFDTVLEYWPRARVEDALSTKRYTDALFVPSTIAVHPLNLTLGLARACTERGGRIFQRTPALSIETRGERPRVRTPVGRITADQVVITCGGYVAGLHGPLSRATIPIATFVMATEPLGDRLARAIRVPYAIFDNQVATNYYRPTSDGRVLWGGRVLAWEPPVERIAQQLRRDMVSFYPALADARIEVAWGGAHAHDPAQTAGDRPDRAERLVRDRLRWAGRHTHLGVRPPHRTSHRRR